MSTGIALTQTTLSGAITPQQNTFGVASATGITAPVGNLNQQLYIIGPGQKRGELVTVVAVSGTQITVSRLDEFKAFWPSGSLVVIGPAPVSGAGFAGQVLGGGFQGFDPPGASASSNSNAAGAVLYSPWINVVTGNQWIWSTVLNCWVPGWQNENVPGVSDAVASANGAVTPSGPFFHMTGNATITAFTLPVGFTHGSFRCIPDHAATSFAWTGGSSATNPAVSGQAIQNRVVQFDYDPATGLWYPSYV